MAISTYLADVWTATQFGDPELSEYAERQLRRDTRTGVQIMAGVSLAMQLCIATIVVIRGIDNPYLYVSLLFGLLSLHVLISANYLRDVRSLHALGMAFLIIGALCLTSVAHQVGELPVGVMAATVMLFVAIPLVPWALRETSVVIGLSYLLLTTSLHVVPGRFAPASLMIFQLLVLGTSIVVLVVSGRNTFIRKNDLRARFDLESAHGDMQLLSMQDHLTGAWNRRYLTEKFGEFARSCSDQGKALHVAILDIDDFKGINDAYGHQAGDRILTGIADIFVRLLESHGRLVRLGGDEFLILYCGDDLDGLIETAAEALQHAFRESGIAPNREITLSAGIVSAAPGEQADIEALYRSADRALYEEKLNRPTRSPRSEPLARTGTWHL